MKQSRAIVSMLAIGIAFAAMLAIAEQLMSNVGAPAKPHSLPSPEAEPSIRTTDGATTAAPPMATIRTDTPPTPRPLPTVATWLTVRIVDEHDRQPVPGARVNWLDDDAIHKALFERKRDATLPLVTRLTLIEDLGWSATSDATGIARVALPGCSTLCATADRRFGILEVDPEALAPTAGYRLLLRRDVAAVILVEDEQGQPYPDVPVGIGPRDHDGALGGDLLFGPRGRTGADGMLIVPHLQTIVAAANRTGQDRHDHWHAFAWLPGAGPGTTFLVTEPPRPIRIRLPATGTVRVRVDARGLELPPLELTLSEQGDFNFESLLKHRNAALDLNHSASFDDVPVHCAYEVRCEDLLQSFAGPRHRGDVVEVTLTLPERHVVVTGRLARPNGAPIAGVDVEIKRLGRLPTRTGSFRTAEDGRFRWLIDRTQIGNAELVLTPAWLQQLRGSQAPATSWRARLAARAYEGAAVDLGDLVVDAEIRLVSGRIRLGDESPPGAPEFTIEIESPPALREYQQWSVGQLARAESKPNGEFTVYGPPAVERHRLGVRVAGTQPVDPIEFEPGATDVDIQLKTGLVLAASVLLPTGAPSDQLRAELIPTSDLRRTDAMRSNLYQPNEDHAQLRWQGLPSGTYTLQLQLAPGLLLHQLAGVTVPPPVGGDARLVGIDLRHAVRVVSIELLGANDRPVGKHGAFFMSAAEPEPHAAFAVDDAVSTLLLPAGCTQLIAHVQGHRPQPFVVSGDPVVVRLTPWRTIDMQIPSAEALPDSTALLVELLPVAPAPRRYRDRWHGQTKELDDHAPFQSRRGVTKGRVTLPIGDGEHHLQLAMWHDDGRTTKVICTMPNTIRWQAEPLILDVSAADWQLLRGR